MKTYKNNRAGITCIHNTKLSTKDAENLVKSTFEKHAKEIEAEYKSVSKQYDE